MYNFDQTIDLGTNKQHSSVTLTRKHTIVVTKIHVNNTKYEINTRSWRFQSFKNWNICYCDFWCAYKMRIDRITVLEWFKSRMRWSLLVLNTVRVIQQMIRPSPWRTPKFLQIKCICTNEMSNVVYTHILKTLARTPKPHELNAFVWANKNVTKPD